MDNNCSICLLKMGNVASLQNCSHSFCVECILSWSRISNSCPICRQIYQRLITSNGLLELSKYKKIEVGEDTFGEDDLIFSFEYPKVFLSDYVNGILLFVVFMSVYLILVLNSLIIASSIESCIIDLSHFIKEIDLVSISDLV